MIFSFEKTDNFLGKFAVVGTYNGKCYFYTTEVRFLVSTLSVYDLIM